MTYGNGADANSQAALAAVLALIDALVAKNSISKTEAEAVLADASTRLAGPEMAGGRARDLIADAAKRFRD